MCILMFGCEGLMLQHLLLLFLQYAQRCGFDNCKEIFSVIKKKHNSKLTNKCQNQAFASLST